MADKTITEKMRYLLETYDYEHRGGGVDTYEITRFLDWVDQSPEPERKHPVDAIKDFGEAAGIKMCPEAEAKMRAICDEEVCASCGQSIAQKPAAPEDDDFGLAVLGFSPRTAKPSLRRCPNCSKKSRLRYCESCGTYIDSSE